MIKCRPKNHDGWYHSEEVNIKNYLYLWFIQAKRFCCPLGLCCRGPSRGNLHLCPLNPLNNWRRFKVGTSIYTFFFVTGCRSSRGWRRCRHCRFSGLKGRSNCQWHFISPFRILLILLWHFATHPKHPLFLGSIS